MEKRQLALALGSIITGLVLVFSSCKKINEATELGGDLIPPIDNIHTFDTTLTVEAFNDMFTLGGPDVLKEDSARSSEAEIQYLGRIDNDPIFGRTEAEMYLELKPAAFPFTFKNRPDSLTLDSVVLVLDYIGTYGDSTAAQMIDVSEITTDFRVDTALLLREKITGIGASLVNGPVSVVPSVLDDSVKVFLDTSKNQLRIRLRNDFGARLLNKFDTSAANGKFNAYSSDSAFKSYFKGFALRSVGTGNALMGFDLEGVNTKLAVYYRYLHGKPDGDIDTTVDYFNFKPYSTYLTGGTACHNYIKRDYAGTPVMAAQGGSGPDPFIYIQNTPGTFARITIPGLGGLNNRVVHRAELIVEQAYDVSDTLYREPLYLFLDAYNPALTNYMTVPYDLIYDASGGLNLGGFGVSPVNKLDAFGHVIRSWSFNLSRYVQHIVNGTELPIDFRLHAPVLVSDYYRPPAVGSEASLTRFVLNPSPAVGRVRLAGNMGAADTNPQRIRLRIVYSKL